MPTVRKLMPEEVQNLEGTAKGPRKLIEEQYDRFLADYDVGEYGAAVLDPGEKRLTVRNRFKAAAGRRHLGLHFPRTTGDIIHFKVISGDGDGAAESMPEPAPEPEPVPVASATPPPAKRRPGRPKKQAV